MVAYLLHVIFPVHFPETTVLEQEQEISGKGDEYADSEKDKVDAKTSAIEV